ncbi:MAG: hypothetical protein P8M16_09185 [Acidimicrobiales bacterium]|nr:hypothetical protein [Acidimicrobiales bacterium]
MVAVRIQLDDHAGLVIATRVDRGLEGVVRVEVGSTTEMAAGVDAAVTVNVDVIHVAPRTAAENDRTASSSLDHAWAAGANAVVPATTMIAVTAIILVVSERIGADNRPVAAAKILVRL